MQCTYSWNSISIQILVPSSTHKVNIQTFFLTNRYMHAGCTRVYSFILPLNQPDPYTLTITFWHEVQSKLLMNRPAVPNNLIVCERRQHSLEGKIIFLNHSPKQRDKPSAVGLVEKHLWLLLQGKKECNSFLQGSFLYLKYICPSLNLMVFIICFTSTFIHLPCRLWQQPVWPYVCLPASKQHPSSHQSISIYHIAGLVS